VGWNESREGSQAALDLEEVSEGKKSFVGKRKGANGQQAGEIGETQNEQNTPKRNSVREPKRRTCNQKDHQVENHPSQALRTQQSNYCGRSCGENVSLGKNGTLVSSHKRDKKRSRGFEGIKARPAVSGFGGC